SAPGRPACRSRGSLAGPARARCRDAPGHPREWRCAGTRRGPAATRMQPRPRRRGGGRKGASGRSWENAPMIRLLFERFEIRENRFDAVADLAALAAEARTVVVDLVEPLLQLVALAAQLLNRGDGALDFLTQPLQDLVVGLCRFLHSSFTGSMSARRAASCCCRALTSSCVNERSNA